MSDSALRSVGDTAGSSPDARRATSILVVDDEPGMRSFLQRALAKHYTMVEVAQTTEEAEALRQRCHFDLLLVDIRLPDRSGVEWLQELRGQGVPTDVIFMTAYADLETAIDALRAGAADFIMKPFRMEQMLAAVKHCLGKEQLRRENFVLKRQVEQVYSVEGLVGDCGSLKEICKLVKRIAPTPSTILIEGESGTGKELAARAVHRLSGRAGAFVPVNCAAISEELFESELFGHTKGAFTGASQAREGLFSYAHGGTLFLDEIGEMPASIQTKLLRVLEQRTIRPVGTNREVPVDVRIVAATNRELQVEVAEGRFREDLFYRLNVVAFRMPALRERAEDIPGLSQHFLASMSAELGVPAVELGPGDLERLKAYAWPGNVRELKNLMERAVLLGESPASLLPTEAPEDDADAAGYSAGLKLDDVERLHILRVLEAAEGNKSEAARRLGVARKTLERKLRAYDEDRAEG
jgi:two-component system NtrC family response regulator